MDNIVELDNRTASWLISVLSSAVLRGQDVRLMTGTNGTTGETYFKVSRGGSMWSAPMYDKSAFKVVAEAVVYGD